jgi:hypothetical protein
MAEFINFERLISKLGSRQREAARGARKMVRVGYSAPYAMKVHENLEIDHEVHGCGGQAKFLEQPARQYRDAMASIVRAEVIGRGGPEDLVESILRGMLKAGLALKEESQRLVPVQTGRLRDSAFVHVEDR